MAMVAIVGMKGRKRASRRSLPGSVRNIFVGKSCGSDECHEVIECGEGLFANNKPYDL